MTIDRERRIRDYKEGAADMRARRELIDTDPQDPDTVSHRAQLQRGANAYLARADAEERLLRRERSLLGRVGKWLRGVRRRLVF